MWLLIIKTISEVAPPVAVAWAAFMAARGIDAWRREFIDKRRMELAEEALTLFYQARDVIAEIRSPFGFGGEGETRKPAPGERAADKAELDGAYVLIERYNKHLELFSKLRAMRYRFMARFGRESANPFDELNVVVNKLVQSSYRRASMTRYPRTSASEEEAERLDQKAREIDSIYFAGFPDDAIAPKVESIVAAVETQCNGILTSKSTLYSLLNAHFPGTRK